MGKKSDRRAQREQSARDREHWELFCNAWLTIMERYRRQVDPGYREECRERRRQEARAQRRAAAALGIMIGLGVVR